MPHYIDGTEATPGDIVRGKGYNVKDENGELAEIVGVLLSVTPNAPACNVTVLLPDGGPASGTFTRVDGETGRTEYSALVSGRIEYGQADHFELVAHRFEA